MNKLLIIDGSNLLFQMFFGMPARITGKDGKAIQGTLGFVGALLKTIHMTCPSHVVVLFDGECRNERRELDVDYKANRTDYSAVCEEESPFSQINDVYAALDCLKIKRFEANCYEADDIIAGYALTYGKDTKIVISSFDSDFFQLITDNVSILRYRGNNSVICTPEYILDNLHISPCQYADFKALVGDNADNIKGADKVGPKTAAKLLGSYGTLDNLIKNAEKLKKTAVRSSILASTEKLKTNYKLIKLENNVPLPFSLNELTYSDTGMRTIDVLSAIGLK